MRNYRDIDELLSRWGHWRAQGLQLRYSGGKGIFSNIPAVVGRYRAHCEECHGLGESFGERCYNCHGRGTVSSRYSAIDPRAIRSTGPGGMSVRMQTPAEYLVVEKTLRTVGYEINTVIAAHYIYYSGHGRDIKQRLKWVNRRMLLRVNLDADEYKISLNTGKRILAKELQLSFSQHSEVRRQAGKKRAAKQTTFELQTWAKKAAKKRWRPILHLTST